MHRRTLCILLCLLLIAPAALADFDAIPSRDVFSMGYGRLQTAIERERPIKWHATVTPAAVEGYADASMEALSAIMSALEMSGTMQANKDGTGRLEATVLSDRREIFSIGQMTQGDRLGLNLGGDWLSFPKGGEIEAAAMLELDDFGMSLMNMDYTGLRSNDMPFLSAIYNQGITLWELASPYSTDSNRLSVPSGSTGHGVVYEIDTAGLRTMLVKWVDQLSMEGLSLGFAGTDLSVGVSEADFDDFVQKAGQFARNVELAKPIRFTTTFGEGDLLRTAKGSGTLQEAGGRREISYKYTCNVSSTRVTRKYNIDFQPREGDTLVLSCTWLTSSNNKTSGAHEVAITASGRYNGEEYRIKINNDLVNTYQVDENGILGEIIEGKLTASLKYAGRTVADITIKRSGYTNSSTGLTSAITIEDQYDVSIANDAGILFAGMVTLGYSVAEGTEPLPDVLADANVLEDMDFMALELLRDSLSDGLAGAKQRLIQSLPLSAMNALLTAY